MLKTLQNINSAVLYALFSLLELSLIMINIVAIGYEVFIVHILSIREFLKVHETIRQKTFFAPCFSQLC